MSSFDQEVGNTSADAIEKVVVDGDDNDHDDCTNGNFFISPTQHSLVTTKYHPCSIESLPIRKGHNFAFAVGIYELKEELNERIGKYTKESF